MGRKRILPLYDADAGPADGVLERETQQCPWRPRGCRRRLFLGLRAVVLSLPLRGTGRGDGPAPSRPQPRPSARRGVAHHLRLTCSVDGRLPAQGRPRRGDVLRGQAHHAHPVVDPAPSSVMVAVAAAAAAAAVLIGQAGGRRPRKGGRGRVIGAWSERRGRGRRAREKEIKKLSSTTS